MLKRGNDDPRSPHLSYVMEFHSSVGILGFYLYKFTFSPPLSSPQSYFPISSFSPSTQVK